MESKCSAFWHHTNIRSDNKIFPCCRFKYPVATFDGDIKEILFYKEYQNLRQQSLENRPINGCEKCYHEEEIGKKSLRQKFNEQYDFENVSIEYLEIGFDNICNLTCDGCYPEFSSAWAKKNNPGADKTIHIKSISEITSVPNTLKKILFLGGEPLMTNRHQKFLKLISSPQNVEVVYNTNGTFLLDTATINILSKFKLVEFILSVDGYRELNDKVRSGSTWNQILSFISQIKNLSFKLSVNTVIHKNNWRGLKDLENFLNEEQLDWSVNFLTFPTHLDILNVEERQELLFMLRSIKKVNLDHLIKRINKDIY